MTEFEFDSPAGYEPPSNRTTPESLDDLFGSPAAIPDYVRERDQWKNTLIEPPPGGWDDPDNPRWELHNRRYGGRRGYQGVGRFADTLNNGVGLAIWSTRLTALYVARNEPLAALLASCRYVKDDFPIIDEAISDAKKAGIAEEKALSAAMWGTALHRFMEPNSPPSVPVKLKADIEAYHAEKARKNVRTLETEILVVNDELETVGAFDELDEVPVCPDCGSVKIEWLEYIETVGDKWGCQGCGAYFPGVDIRRAVMIGDKKTGKLHPLEQCIQLAAYAHSKRYDPVTGERSPIHPDLSLRWGILIHIPLGSGQATLYAVDIEAGCEMAKVALAAREGRRGEKALFGLWDDLKF